MRLLQLFFVALLLSCSTQKSTPTPPVDENPRPGWVRQKPVNNTYYHGIGFAYKVPGRNDHNQMARSNALNDLAGEISVEISAQSLLYQVESNQRVRETYKSTIMSSSTASLEGYELVSVWENDREVWSFYRLSKAEYQRIQREKRLKATKMSVSQWQNANRETDPYRMFLGYVSALDAVKEYLGEPLTTDIDGERVFLANQLMRSMRQLTDEWLVQPSEHVVEIKRGQSIRVPSSFWDGPSVFFTVTHLRKPLVNVPCELMYSGRRNHRQASHTDRNGHVFFTWDRVVSQRRQEQLNLQVNLREIALESSSNELILSLVDQLRQPAATLTLEIIPPRIRIHSDEVMMGKAMEGNPLQTAFAAELRQDGFMMASANDADYVMDIRARTREGNGVGQTTQFVTAYLDITIQVVEQASGQVIFSRQIDGIRGVQLDEERAARESFSRAVRDIQRDIYPDMRRKAFW